MTLIALVALAFNAYMAFSIYKAVSTEVSDGWSDYVSTALVAAGSLAGVIVSVNVLVKAMFS